MTDYTKLVHDIRAIADELDCKYCGIKGISGGCKSCVLYDAADAIEELKDMPWVESVQVDKLRQRIDELEETACHCNVRENAELIAKILDDDVDGKVYQMPKRGEIVRCGECVHCYAEGFVHERNICEKHPELGNVPDDWFCADGEREVQDESQNNRSYRE